MHHDRRSIILIAIVFAGLVVAGLAIPGVVGGALLLLVALLLAALTAALRGQGVPMDSRNWTLRALVVMAIAAIGLVKLF